MIYDVQVVEYFLLAEERELTQSFFYFTEQGSKEARAKKKAAVTEKAKKAVRCYFPPRPAPSSRRRASRNNFRKINSRVEIHLFFDACLYSYSAWCLVFFFFWRV